MSTKLLPNQKVLPEPSSSKTSSKQKSRISRNTDNSKTSRLENSLHANEMSILVIGATGGTGLATLQRLARHETKPKIHAFCQNVSRLPDLDRNKCDSVLEGDARERKDIERALSKTRANVVVVCIGNSNCLEKKFVESTDVRAASAKALVTAMKKKKFKYIRAVVVSRSGVQIPADSRNKKQKEVIWKRIITRNNSARKTYKLNLQNVLDDHARQECIFLSSLPERTCIVRPTALKDGTKAKGTVQVFRDEDEPSPAKMSRLDLASWIAEEICCGLPIGGRVVNITGAKK